MSGRLGSPGQLWLYRTKPLDDELFSSWLVRLAWGNAVKLQSFCVSVLELNANFWTTDVDRTVPQKASEILATGTSTPQPRIAAMGLDAYCNALWAEDGSIARAPWITVIKKFGRRRVGHGQQFCRLCLASDDVPYFRRRWRLAFNVVCVRHQIFLQDACAHCQAPVEFHTGDFGVRLLEFDCQISCCGTCGSDFRVARFTDQHAPLALIQLQNQLNALLYGQQGGKLPGSTTYAHLFFEGLRCLVQLLASRARGQRLRDRLLHEVEQLPLGVSSARFGAHFEELRVGDRATILELASKLFEKWPSDFVRYCKDSRVSSSYINRYKGKDIPFWLWSEIQWHLYDKDYAATKTERQAVRKFLETRQESASRNAINYWLGASSVGHGPFKAHRERWNPRGPTRKMRNPK